MSRKSTQDTVEIEEIIVEQEMPEALDARFTKYAFSVLEDRALPDARDGLKPSQRRILVAMNDLGLSPGGSTVKCAKICGDTSGNYHPHGEASTYPALVRLAQPWSLREPLITGQGNFGNVDGDPPAAMRYTEAKFSKFGESLVDELSKDTVKYIPTYDEKREEPTVLPAKLPNLIINGCSGIAVGWATNMPPHNLKEVTEAVISYIKNPDITAEKLIRIMPGPDFPVEGRLLGQAGVLDYYRTGKGSIKIEGKYEIKEDSKGNKSIHITQVPYQGSPEQLCVEIKNMVTDGKITGISDLKNLSSKKSGGILIVVDVVRNHNPNLVINNLLKNTCLRKTFSINQTVLIDGKVVADASLVTLIKAFVDHRLAVLTSKFTAEFARNSARINILDGLIKVSSRIDETIKIIRAAENPVAAQEALLKAKIIDNEPQAKAVLAITLSQLTKLENNKLVEERAAKNERNEWLNKVLKDQKEILQVIAKEQKELASKFGSERRTEIISDANDIEIEDLIKDEQVVISLTGDGYVRSTSVDNYRIQNRGGMGSAGISKKNDGEDIFEMFEAGSKDLLLFFSDLGLVYQKKAYEVAQSGKTGKGIHVSNLLSLKEGEAITNVFSLKTLDQDGYLTIATKHGFIKRSELREYNSNRKNSGLTAIKLDDDDKVSFVMLSDGNRDIFLVTANGQCVRYPESIVSIQGRATRGSRSMKLDSSDSLVQIFTIDKDKTPDILVVTSGGHGKRTSSTEYRSLSGRNVKGYSVINKKALEKNGLIAGACPIYDGDSFLVLTSKGNVLRTNSNNIRETGRTTNGVRVVSLEQDNKVTRISRISESEENTKEE